MRKIYKTILGIFFCFIFFTDKINAQTFFMDIKNYTQVTLNHGARSLAERKIKDDSEAIKDNTNKINENMLKVLATKQIIYNSLYQVNELVKDGKEVKHIVGLVDELRSSYLLLRVTARDFPEGLVFVSQYGSYFYSTALELYNDLHDAVLTEDPKQLMDYNKRDELLREVSYKLKMLRAQLDLIHSTIYWAKMDGFWRTLNPFKNVINQDKMIINDILSKAQQLK